jgi:peptide chain release factor subunit 1
MFKNSKKNSIPESVIKTAEDIIEIPVKTVEKSIEIIESPIEKPKEIIKDFVKMTKDEFLDNDYLTDQLQNKVIGRVDIGDTDEAGLKELVEKSQDLLAQQEVVYEKKLIQKFFQTLGEKPDLALYKEQDIRKALQYGAVETLILSHNYDKIASKELRSQAKGISANIEFISTDTEEGKQFSNLSGIGAMLRFKI